MVAFDAKSAPGSSATAPLTKTAAHALPKKLKFQSVLSPDDKERAIRSHADDRRPSLKCSPYTVVCKTLTLHARRGLKMCASLVGGEEGEGGGRRTLAPSIQNKKVSTCVDTFLQ